MIVTTSQLARLAYARFAIGAFSVNTLEQIVGAFRGATKAAAPLIIQISHYASCCTTSVSMATSTIAR
jgi:fructose-bisphosphate aldolase class II